MYKKKVIHLLFAILATASFNTAAQCEVTAHPPPPFPAGLPTDLPKPPIVDARDIDWPDTPYMDGRILRTLKRQGVLPSAVPSPVATNERYFRYVRVTPATVKLWRIGTDSVWVPGGTDPFQSLSFEKQFSGKEAGYSVSMTVRDKSRFGLMQYTDTLSLAICGIDEPGILEVPRWVRMKPSVKPDQQTFTSNYYDLARHPELSRITVSASLQPRDLWPLGCFGLTVLCLFFLLPVIHRSDTSPDEERRQQIMHSVYLWMLKTYALILPVTALCATGLGRVLSMWYSPDDAKWIRIVAIMVNLAIPYAVWAMTKSVLLRATHSNARYYKLINNRNTIFAASLVFFVVVSTMVPSNNTWLLVCIGLIAVIPYQFKAKYDAKLHSINLRPQTAEEDDRLRRLQTKATSLLAPHKIECPSMLLVSVPHSSQEPVSDTATSQLTVPFKVIGTLNDDELLFFICQHLIQVKVIRKQKGNLFFTYIMFMALLAAIWTLMTQSAVVFITAMCIVWMTSRLMDYYLLRWADKLTVEMMDNRGVAISALHKMEQNTVGEGLFALRRKSLESFTHPA